MLLPELGLPTPTEVARKRQISTGQFTRGASTTLYERLGGAYAIASTVDHLIDRLHTNTTINHPNPKVKGLHTEQYRAGYKFMVQPGVWRSLVAGSAIRARICSRRTHIWG
jgi:hypothetical protein